MPRRALLKFRNPDSTQDLNDRFKDLFNKGFFSGGALTAVPGVLKVDLAPFATAGSDGMFVREDSETTRLDVVANFKNYIVIRQEYISNADPVISIESLTEPEFLNDGPIGAKGANNPTLIVFGVVNVPSGETQTDINMIETFESDIVDNLGRSSFRGLLTAAASLPAGSNSNRAGDFYIITDGAGDFPGIHSWNGVSWINITNAQSVLDLFNNHIQNLNTDEIHLTTLQAQAVAGSAGIPTSSNLFVTEEDNRLLTDNQADANAGNGLPLEDFGPSNSNRWISSSKVFAVPTEVVVSASPPGTSQIELGEVLGGFFIGEGSEAIQGTAQQWFNIYAEDTSGDEEYTNNDFNSVQVLEVRFGDAGVAPIDLATDTTEVDPQTNADGLGFFVTVNKSLYLVLSNPITSPCRVAYGKRGSLGALLPHLLMNRGPKGGQIDTRLVRLLFGTPNAQFEDADLWDPTVLPGAVVSFNSATNKFVNADPDGGLFPVGVKGNFNNLIMEGLYTANSSSFSIDFLYADKASPGSLTNVPNEWFIGRAISATQLLVNMNQIPLPPGDVPPPISFPEGLFQSSLQAGQTLYWTGTVFDKADSITNLPLGIRGNNNNVIQSGKYVALTGTPFVSGTRVYAGTVAGTLVTTENDWFMGIGIDSTTLLVNANAVAIPAKWSEEHHTDSGFHKFKVGNDTDRNAIPSPDQGMLFIRDDLPEPSIEYFNGIAWVAASSSGIIPVGSKMLFIQNTVPTGWTLDVAANDRVIRVVNVEAQGGLTAGSWTITGFQADPHALTISEMPAHMHGIDGVAISTGTVSGVNGMMQNLGGNTDSTGGGATHQHTVSNDGNWRPSYINAIICIKD